MRQNYILTWPVFAERAKLVQKMPHFWAIVAEEAPEEIDRFIQPCDTDVLSSLQTINVTRFEISLDDPGVGEPRSVKITFSFRENPWFEDRVLEKMFWYRCGRTGWTGLVSEPVRIHWKEGKDLTEGLLEDACCVYEITTAIKRMEAQIRKGSGTEEGMKDNLNERRASHRELVEKLDHKLKSTPQDALSFFAWFGYRGKNVSAEESAEVRKELARRRKHLKSENGTLSRENSMTDEREVESSGMAPDEADETGLDHEIFPAGEELAVAISEDLYPGAIKYFSQLLAL